jgi:hypothetical protein
LTSPSSYTAETLLESPIESVSVESPPPIARDPPVLVTWSAKAADAIKNIADAIINIFLMIKLLLF